MSNARDKANIPALNFSSTGIDDNATSTAITIDSDERVGLQYTTPSNLNASADDLVIGGGSGSKGLTIFTGAFDNGSIFFADGTSVGEQNRGSISYAHSGNSLRFGTSSTERMRINGTGVGIGTTSPNRLLTLGGTSNARLALNASSYSDFTLTSDVYGFSVYDDDNTAYRLTVKNNGNVGIGETAPLGKLHIKTGDSGQGTAQGEADELVIEGSANAGINILSGSTSLGMISFGDVNDANIGFIHYNHNNNAMTFRTNTSDTMIIDSAGHVTKPLQPAVHAYSSSAQNDIANGIVTIQLDAEIYDVNSDFNTSNYTFTAPVTGKYLVSSNVDLTDIDTATQWLYGALIVTSNRNYYASLIDPRNLNSDSNQSFSSSTLVDMDANDTLVLKVRSSSHGAAQMNVTITETYMTIVLSC